MILKHLGIICLGQFNLQQIAISCATDKILKPIRGCDPFLVAGLIKKLLQILLVTRYGDGIAPTSDLCSLL